jgi:hypothetical protein
MNWSFAGVTLPVQHKPLPVRTSAHRWDVVEYPGVDGADLIPDARGVTRYTVTVLATDKATYETLVALFESGARADLHRPVGTDYWIYRDAAVDGEVSWEEYARGDSRPSYNWARVTFVCPDPRPYSLNTGERVF